MMALVEETLEQVAQGGGMDYDNWPLMLEPLLERINKIAYNEFPTTHPYPVINHPVQLEPNTQDGREATEPLEDPMPQPNGAPIPVTPVRNLPPVPQFISSVTSATHVPDSMPPSQDELIGTFSDPQPPLHPTLLQLLGFITRTLQTSFSSHPPHTLQRFAELLLDPTRHYRNLPAWLRAVDRTVSVSSTANIFPLPHAQALPNSIIDSSLLNGDHRDNSPTSPATGTSTGGGGILWNNNTTELRNGNIYDERTLGSDESLGGALLTPIPWLKNGLTGESHESHTASNDTDTDDGDMLAHPIPLDNMVPERTDGAVTQGELIRQEQEAGVVPVTSGGNSRMVSQNDILLPADEGEDGDESIPHARGPELVGTVDMGLVDGKALEAQTGGLRGRDMHDSQPVDKDVNNAQDVLMDSEANQHQDQDQGQKQSQTETETETENSTGLTQPAREMQLDSQKESQNHHDIDGADDGDKDIVLTDVDGRTQEETRAGGTT